VLFADEKPLSQVHVLPIPERANRKIQEQFFIAQTPENIVTKEKELKKQTLLF